jgi:fluoride exporter
VAKRVRPADLLLVWVGGTLGTAVRVAVSPPHDASTFPMATFVVNLVGAALLGLLVERLVRREETFRERRLSLLLGTGFLGGFTTYSALAVDTVQLLRAGATGLAVAYAVGTLVLGAVATWLGLAAGRARRSSSE